jgi:hypothetical protein
MRRYGVCTASATVHPFCLLGLPLASCRTRCQVATYSRDDRGVWPETTEDAETATEAMAEREEGGDLYQARASLSLRP